MDAITLIFWPHHYITFFFLFRYSTSKIKNLRIWVVNKEMRSILNFNFYVPCQTSPRWCSWGSSGGWIIPYRYTMWRVQCTLYNGEELWKGLIKEKIKYIFSMGMGLRWILSGKKPPLVYSKLAGIYNM